MSLEETVERVVPGTESWDLYGYEHMQRYEKFAPLCAGKKVLDAACGTGYGSLHLLQAGKASSVLGIDVAEDAIAFATRYNATGLHYKKHDCMNLSDLGEQFDVVISFETIEHLSNPQAFIQQAHDVLKPGGVFVCSTPNKDRLSGAGNINPFHPSELPYDEFRAAMAKHFDIEEELHQSETVAYFRYMELKHMIVKMGGRMEGFMTNRLEKGFRKMVNKSFVYDPFMRNDLENLMEGDMEILPLSQGPKSWHKTYIIQGRKKG
jgi:SAM-dependent methyltransferase